MNLRLNTSLSNFYRSSSQLARVMTERWVEENIYCPCCGNEAIEKLANNSPVADFSCSHCENIFELKSVNGAIPKKVVAGAYSSMIERITSKTNPDFLFMSYNREEAIVNDLVVIPKHFFVPEIIEIRPPLAATARRAGWIGCSILLDSIPSDGWVYLIKNREVRLKTEVVEGYRRTAFLADTSVTMRGWLLDTLNCINRLDNDRFTLSQMYAFEDELMILHPENNYIRPKIRQQLQILRDKGFISFLSRGTYRKN